MAIQGRDKEFRLPKVTYVDHTHIEIDRVLTLLFPRLRFDGHNSRRPPRKSELSLEEFTKEFLEHPEWFSGFTQYPDVVRKWIETDLMDLVNRGKPNQAIAAPRPLHGNTYKFRNARHTRDYGAADQLYWMLYYARRGRGQTVRDALKRFFFLGIDLNTDRYNPQVAVDVETQALLRLDQQVTGDMRDSKAPNRFSPLCIGQADFLADDIRRLLVYEKHIPRSVLVDYLKTLLSFHLALYHLRLLKLLPSLVHQRSDDPICTKCPVDPDDQTSPHGNCPHRIGLVVDMGDPNNSHMTALAYRSADSHYRRIPKYIEAQFITKKLDEFVDYLTSKLGKQALPSAGSFSVGQVLEFLGPKQALDRDAYFKARLASLVEESKSGKTQDVDPEVQRVLDMGLDAFETYIEILIALRSKFHRERVTKCLDSFLMKNSDTGLLAQARAKGSPRYFSMGSRLLEVLLQIAVLTPQGTSFKTREVRIEELLQFLRERYGIYIDQLPSYDGFQQASILDRQALRQNVNTFKTRLREIGFFQDLSDAYITQTVTPRYTITQDARR
ncbi:MAG TPA: hypothetical protein V6C84_28370 [Coleofasciculaceae cyanobacterium]|jgi:hypothetical protein